jgi:molybdopterin synthase sulfur carrier subunit
MIKVLYFARLRESLGLAGEELDLPQKATVAELMTQLAARGGAWQQEFTSGRVRAAINQTLASQDAVINSDDEVAFFPPVTGG